MDKSQKDSVTLSKKEQKKLEKKLWKAQKAYISKQETDEILQNQNKLAQNFEEDNYGYLSLIDSSYNSERIWSDINSLNTNKENERVWIRARLYSSRKKGSLCFLVLRQKLFTIQCILDAGKFISKDIIQWTASVPLESIMDIYGIIKVPDIPVTSTSQNVEIEVLKIFCSSKSSPDLPFLLKDINRISFIEDDDVINVNQDTRLDNRIIDLRGIASQAIFFIQSHCCQIFRSYLIDKNFTEIHTPKILEGASEGGSSCFSLKYFDQTAFLAQSPQLFKQMAINADFDRVFEIGPVFRAENSNTHRHLCEFIGLDLEMTFNEHYFEVVDFIDDLLKNVFSNLAQSCKNEISTVYNFHPSQDFKWLKSTLKLQFIEGLELLKENGCKDIPDDISEYDLSTEKEKFLGKIIKKKYDTDYYILYRYPTKARAFYSMPCADDPVFCNSYDFFMRGEEILSGAQRIHDFDILKDAVIKRGIPIETLNFYINSFKYGSYPHAGCGIGLERFLMLYLGLSNIRKTSLFPRDPKRLSP